jgi:uncharacterized protein YycO
MLNLTPCDIVLVDGSGFISKAIEKVEYGLNPAPREYSHVAGYVGHGQLIEAEGFRRTGYADLGKYSGYADVFRCPSMSYDQREEALKLARWNVGGRYDWKLLPWEFIRYVFKIALPYREPPKARICSSLWAVGIYREVGIDLCPGIRYPTPKDVSESKLLIKVGSL